MPVSPFPRFSVSAVSVFAGCSRVFFFAFVNEPNVNETGRHTLQDPCRLIPYPSTSIRIATKLLEEESEGRDSPLFDFIETCLRHKSELVIYEAAHAIVNMPNTSARELAPAISVLQLFCSSPKPTLRFAAVRTLNKVAMKHPAAVAACNLDLENLITDVNRSIATLAITTLLKTGSESSVDRLMKQISTFMSEISDEFKIVVGGFDYKRAIVDSLIGIIEENPEAKEAGLAHLCEFIEDCEHTVLATRILHLLGREGPRTPSPSKYIRFIYNRVILENAAVRAGLNVSVVGLERALHSYTQEPSETQFDMKSVPLATQPLAEQKAAEVTPAAKAPDKVAATRQDIYAEQLAAIPEFQGLGPLFKSSAAVQLTESETEYVFDCTNTLNDQILENVTVQMEPTEGFEVLSYVPAASLPYGQPGITYTCVTLPEDDPTSVIGTFSNTLKFLVKDCDPNTGEPDEEGYEDEYVLEDVEVTIADHIQKVLKPNFAASWDEVGEDYQMEDTYALSTVKTLEDAVKNIVDHMGMQPCERSDKVPADKSAHTLFLAGVYRGGHDVLVRARLAVDDGVTMQITVRSTDETAAEVISASVG
uniref:Coatomer subunit gamma n=1 Tax=Branchiostoma floridae TaxID=7739 RepID=C3YUH2_BRAFL|eukprot:XP_002600080.1 hypothetical protein BRAFLDRAFT_122413 [Branchiostoma floridae]